ncbi:beta-galactosidase GalA [Sphingomonas sp. TREG-RG-20F-R18-01]|uniref:beta-galactosidase GalA n=1 Tax=Sphingomonas sp. TREG-RG-20F-R18-01 TaxID=2914982 RepID=UPI001F595050|nr:beta-galactosidase GalA [Sphingomonas sp. TREG-RG-20F-R18-01]
MTQITRRLLVGGGLALPTVASLSPPGRAAAQPDGSAPRVADSPAALAPRERIRFDRDWRFALGHGSDPSKDFDFGIGQADFSKTGIIKIATAAFDDKAWRSLDLPHDWAVELPFVQDDTGAGDSQLRSHGYRPLGRRYPATSVGWYRRSFNIPKSDLGRRITIEFDGAMRDVLVFVNGCFIGRNDNGYAPFRFDCTDFLEYGGTNVIAVRVDASFGDGWFYEGAGLYRHVWLSKTDPVHFGAWETVVRAVPGAGGAMLDLVTTVENMARIPADAALDWTIVDARGVVVARATAPVQTIAPAGSAMYRTSARVTNPALWSLDTPNLYTAVVKVVANGTVRDSETVSFGIRSARFDADRGFFLNDTPIKIQGTCNHQDHAGVGAALPDRLQTFRLGVLKGMGCNAVRTSHNMPTPEWVEACDRMGVMMLCETRQMSSNPSGMAELERMVKRFRNSPSIIGWSIGNEEFLLQQGALAPQGTRIAQAMVDRCHALDPTRPVTAAVNWNNEAGPSEPLDIVGFNYHPEFPEPFHKAHPARPIYGSETSSAIATRGEYRTDAARHTMSSYDGVVGWGTTPEQWWSQYGAHDWLAGGFAWTGFDYRGEPTPYAWPSNSSQFGIVDLCGFPKDYYYYYKAWWSTAPSLHLFPHWNWAGQEGKPVSVWVYSNLDDIELLLNGQSLGRKPMPRLKHVAWQVPYVPGVIEATGRRNGQVVLRERRETTGPGRRLRLAADRMTIAADGRDVAVLTVELLDARGRPVPTANDALRFRVTGAGKLLGVGNGNPNSLESDTAPQRALFNGLAQLIVQSTGRPGAIMVDAVAASGQGSPVLPASVRLTAAQAPTS